MNGEQKKPDLDQVKGKKLICDIDVATKATADRELIEMVESSMEPKEFRRCLEDLIQNDEKWLKTREQIVARMLGA